MRGTQDQIAAYLASAANLLGRYSVDLALPSDSDAVELLEDSNGNLSFELLGTLPGSQDVARSELAIREGFERLGPDQYERTRYEFELVDRGREYRCAFHMHFTEWFVERYQVVVHEHCERPVGRVACEHYEGSPIKDAFAGILKLIEVWTDAPPDCATLACLD
ncbi:MAG: hypothetical protein C0498_09130 [Anaerolinea sp.]|nr:hypothetical protein [Anaerolinea sp.]